MERVLSHSLNAPASLSNVCYTLEGVDGQNGTKYDDAMDEVNAYLKEIEDKKVGRVQVNRGGPSSVYAYSSVATMKCGVLMENDDNYNYNKAERDSMDSQVSHATEEKEEMILESKFTIPSREKDENSALSAVKDAMFAQIMNNGAVQEVSVMNDIVDDMDDDDFDDDASSLNDYNQNSTDPEESLLDCFKETIQ